MYLLYCLMLLFMLINLTFTYLYNYWFNKSLLIKYKVIKWLQISNSIHLYHTYLHANTAFVITHTLRRILLYSLLQFCLLIYTNREVHTKLRTLFCLQSTISVTHRWVNTARKFPDNKLYWSRFCYFMVTYFFYKDCNKEFIIIIIVNYVSYYCFF